MGYNTVVVLLNDGLHAGAIDPKLGARIRDACHAWSARADRGRIDLDIFARLECGMGGSSYGSVISQDHADGYQVTVTHGNCGWRVDNAEHDKHLGLQAFDAMKACLQRNGYRVTKKTTGRR